MVALPSRADITNVDYTKPEMLPFFGDFRDFVAQLPGGAPPSELTIDGGTIEPTGSIHTVDTEADDPADDLDAMAIDDLPEGSVVALRPKNTARVVTIRALQGGDGEFVMRGPAYALADNASEIAFRRVGSQWVEVWRWLAPMNTRLEKTGAYTVANADKRKFIACASAPWTLTFGAASGYDSDFFVTVQNESTTRAISVAPDGLAAFWLYPGQFCRVYNQNNVWKVERPGRWQIAAALSFYVRADGSDANDGLDDSAGGAFLTVQKAIDFATDALDCAGYTVTVVSRLATDTAGVLMKRPVLIGFLVLEGDTTTPSNCTISTTSKRAVAVEGSGVWLTIKGFKIQTTTSGHGLEAIFGGRITLGGNMDFGTVVSAHMHAAYGGFIDASVAYIISGGAAYHFWSETFGSAIRAVAAVTVTITGSPTISYFAVAAIGAGIVGVLVTYSGAVTGTRYLAQTNGVIYTSGGGGNYFPGTIAGTAVTGQYA